MHDTDQAVPRADLDLVGYAHPLLLRVSSPRGDLSALDSSLCRDVGGTDFSLFVSQVQGRRTGFWRLRKSGVTVTTAARPTRRTNNAARPVQLGGLRRPKR